MPKTIFSEDDYNALHALVFRDDYPGYRPTVKEIPNGDGRIDYGKRYAHVATKYLTAAVPDEDAILLMDYLQRAHDIATAAAMEAEIPEAFLPDIRYGALRVLDYPPGSTSNPHFDFSLYTLMCYRDQPKCFRAIETEPSRVIRRIRSLNPQAHLGEIAEEIGLGTATMHEVLSSDERQKSIVYFAIPDHAAVLPPNGAGTRVNVGAWLNERMRRSRIEASKYE